MISSLRAGTARHPEWWTLALCGGAWIVLLLHDGAEPAGIAFCGQLNPAGTSSGGAGLVALANAAIMTAAMMLPLVLVQVRRTAVASLWRRRNRAIAGFLFGYVSIWLLLIAGEAALLALSRPGRWAPVAIFAVAGLWEATPLKRLALSLCHRTIPMRPRGWRADVDCARYGMLHGQSCILSCWAIMLGAMAVPARLPAMAGFVALCAMERYWPRRQQRIETAALAGAALGCTVLALV